MKITLDNYKSYSSKTLELPETGLVKLSGPSGKGKTNFFSSVLWVLFGKQTNVLKYGETKCSVEIEDFICEKIKRTKGPNTLLVDGLESDLAQSHIVHELGMTELEFEVSSYIMQDQKNTFIHCRPAEQLQILHSLAFGEDNPEQIKEKIKNLIAQAQKNRADNQTALSVIAQEIETTQSGIEDLATCVVGINIDELTKKINDTSQIIHAIEKTNEDLVNVYLEAEEKFSKLEEESANPKRGKLQKARQTLDFLLPAKTKDEEWFATHPEEAEYISRHEEISTLCVEIENLRIQKQDYEDTLVRIADLNGCKRKQTSATKKLVDCLQRLPIYDFTIEDIEHLRTLIDKYVQAAKDVESAAKTGPELNDPTKQLEIKEQMLEKVENEQKNELARRAERQEKKVAALRNNIRIEGAQKTISEYADLLPDDILQAALDEAKERKRTLKDSRFLNDARLNVLRSEMKQSLQFQEQLRLIDKRKLFLEERKSEKGLLEASLERKQKKLTNLLRLSDLAQKAALDALEARVAEINLRAEPWIETMFGGQIQAAIETERELKSGNVSQKISLLIHENGIRIDKKEDLSGGQQSRLALAFQLALSDMYDSPILILDECLKGCDTETQRISLEVIKQVSQNKLVLMVEHHVDDSQFDLVVEI